MHAKYTPGSWTASPDWEDGGKPIYTRNKAGMIVTVAHATNLLAVEANACLIAAAPKMLEALQRAKYYMRTLTIEGPYKTRTLEQVRAAIALATDVRR